MSNSASVRLSDDGKMSIYNLAGSVHFTLDITGYYASHNHNDLYYTKAELDPLTPVAVIHVLADGTLVTETHRAPVTGTPTVSKSVTGLYDVSFPGISFFNNADAATCTSADSQPRFVSVNSLTGAMRVRVFDVNEAPMDGGFYCSVYDLG